MWLKFKSDSPEEIERKRQGQAAVDALLAGDILPRAKKRIMHQTSTVPRLFSTDMTTKEFLVMEECGVEPLGQVMGTSFYRIQNYNRINQYTTEMSMIVDAHVAARNMAVERMKKEAALFGAHGIVSVRIKYSKPTYASNVVEFTAIGTAVKLHGWDPEDLEDLPFTSELNGQEFWQLIHAGYRPVSIVFGISCRYIRSDYHTANMVVRRGILNTSMNQEITDWTRNIYVARELAVQRLQDDIVRHNADGCVGMTVGFEHEHIHSEKEQYEQRVAWVDLQVTFTALGSSIRKLKRPHKVIERKPLTVLNLSNKRFVSLGSRTNELGGSILEEDFED